MTYLQKLQQDHPLLEHERAVMEYCPHDFGYGGFETAPCVQEDPGWQDCTKCWEREAGE